MSKIVKRILTMALALTMLIGYLPGYTLPTRAVETTGTSLITSVGGLGAEYTELEGGSSKTEESTCEWKPDGKIITLELYQPKSASAASTTLTLKNNLSAEAHLTFKWEATKVRSGSTITCTLYDAEGNAGTSMELFATGDNGEMDVILASGAYITFKVSAVAPGRNNTEAITFKLIDLNLYVDEIINTTFQAVDAAQGSYTVNGNDITANTTLTQKAAETYEVVATPAEGYVFSGWYSVTTDTYLATSATATLQLDKDQTVYPMFIKAEDAVWSVGNAYFKNLDDATYCAERSQDKVVVLLKDHTLTGSHVIPKDVVVLVPFNAEGTCYTTVPGTIPKLDIDSDGSLNDPAAWQVPYAYRTLTLAANAELIVKGGLSVSAQHHGGGQITAGAPSGPCGFLKTESGSKITIENGGALYAWGYVVGSGKVEAMSGAAVYENLQLTDFRGGSASSQFVNTDPNLPSEQYVVFPFTQYYVQNIEIPLTIHSGAKEVVQVTVYAAGDYMSIPVDFIGTDKAMFRMESGASITKEYDGTSDRLIITVNGNVSLNGMTVVVPGFTSEDGMSSSMFNLPINSNITINVNSGTTTVSQNVALLPGAVVNIAKNAKMFISEGWNLYVYDRDEWMAEQFVYSNTYLKPICWTYANGQETIRTTASLLDAKINVNGMLEVWGHLYTTAGGANICTSEGTGVVVLWAGAGDMAHTYQTTQSGTTVDFKKIPLTAAQLVNANSTYTSTEDADPDAGAAYIYNPTTGKWESVVIVKFEGNGGDGSMDNVELPALDVAVPEDEDGNVYNEITLPECEFTYGIFDFLGWNTQADGKGDWYYPGEFYAVTGNVTLYAIWDVTFVTYTYMDHNGNIIYTEVVAEGSVPNYPTNLIGPAEETYYTYVFVSWARQTDDNGNVTYTATYNKVAKKFNVTFMDGQQDHAETIAEESNNWTVTAVGAPVAPSGKVFAGWSDGTNIYQIGDSITVTGKLILTAVWNCAHASTKAVPNGDGTHKIVCANDACGALITASEKCSGGNATCTEQAVCSACKEAYGELAEHSGTYYFNWSYNDGEYWVDLEFYCPACEDTKLFSKYHAGNEIVTATCQMNGIRSYKFDFSGITLPEGWKWENFELLTINNQNAVWNAETKVLTYDMNLGEDADNHTGKVVYTNNGDNHSAIYNCCDADYVINEAHTYEDHICVCGAKFTGWVGKVYYKDAVMLTGWQEVEGVRYYFHNETGIRAEGLTLIEDEYFLFGPYGDWKSDYNGIYNDNGDLYWIENGVAVANKGMVRVYEYGEAYYYYFGCGQSDCDDNCNVYTAQKGGVHWVANANGLLPNWDYTFGADGIIVHDDALNNSDEQNHEIAIYEGVKYYTIDGIKVHYGLFEMDGSYYYARSNGALVCGKTYWITDVNNTGFAEGSYTFDEEGRMIMDGIVDGYYYVAGVRTYAGLIKLDGAYYYVRTNGQVATGNYWITKTNGLMPQGSYEFAADGKMLNAPAELPGVEDAFTGIKGGYYYENGVVTYAGLIKYNGAYYYVRSNGQVATGTYWITKTNGEMAEGSYTFDADGKMVMDGIVDGYYYVAGVRTYAGLIEIEGKYYYIRTNGQVATGTYWITKTNGEMEAGAYQFGEDGAMIME